MLWHQLIACFALGLALSQVPVARSQVNGTVGCPPGFSRVAKKCLQPIPEMINWFAGERECRAKDAELLSLVNAEELQLITQWLISAMPQSWQVWTSGNSLGGDGTFYWQSTGQEALFLPWDKGQPQTWYGDCLLLNGINNAFGINSYQMHVSNCDALARVVCEQTSQDSGQPAQTITRICLRPDSIESVQVLVN